MIASPVCLLLILIDMGVAVWELGDWLPYFFALYALTRCSVKAMEMIRGGDNVPLAGRGMPTL